MKFGIKCKRGASIALSLSMILGTASDIGFIKNVKAAEISNGIQQNVKEVTENATFNELREKWDYLLVGGDAFDNTEKDVATYISEINKKANDLYSKMFDPNHDESTHDEADGTCSCVFSDVPLSTDKAVKDKLGKTYSSRITMTYDNLKAVTLSYRTKGTDLYKSTEARDKIIKAFQYMDDNHYGIGTHRTSANWFDYDIGTPLRYLDTLVMMYDDLTDEQRTEFLSGVKNTIDKPSYTTGNYTGANMVWKQQVLTVYSILTGTLGANTGNDTMVVEAKTKLDKMKQDIKVVFSFVTSGDGFYKDGSFVQHTYYPYTGGYGKALLVTMAPLMNLLNSSEWELKYDDKSEQMFYDMLFEAYEPFIYKSLMMDMVRNREISRSCGEDNISGRQVIRSFVYMADVLEGEQKEKCLGLIKHWIDNDPDKQIYIDPVFSNGGFVEYFVYMPVILKCKEIEKDSSIKPIEPEKMHKRYPSMDRVVHRTDNFTAGLAMHSDRIATYEVVNTEGTNMWHTADGMLYVYDNDIKKYADDFWGTVDHGRLPGTTVEKKEKSSSYRASARNKYNWVGGTDIDGKYGVSGIHMNNDVDSKKSYFFFDDEIVAVGSDIKSNTGETGQVETIIDNKKLLDDKSNEIKINGQQYTSFGKEEEQKDVKYMHITGNAENSDTGYYFPKGENVTALTETRTQSWLLMNNYEKFKDSVDRTKSFATFYINHGEVPDNANYEYVMLPGKTDEQTRIYSENPEIEVISNTSNVHAVREKKLGITAINFWEASSFAGISVDKSASVMTKDEANNLKISVADPTQKESTIVVEILQPSEGLSVQNDNITVLQTSPTTKLEFNVKDLTGGTIETSLILSDINNSFESTPIGEIPNGWTGNTIQVVEGGAIGTLKSLKVDGTASTDIMTKGENKGLELSFDYVGENAQVLLFDSAQNKICDLTLNNDIWSAHKILFNMDKNTYSYYINHEQIFENQALPTNDGSITSLQFVSSGEAIKVDNVFYKELDTSPMDKPTGLKYTSYGSDYINLQWDTLEDKNGKKITYKLYMDNNEPILTEETSYEVKNLKPSTEYKFKLVAVNSIGDISPESDILTIRTGEELKADYSETFDQYTLGAEVDKAEIGNWTPTGNAASAAEGTATIVKNPASGSVETDYVLKAESFKDQTERGASIKLPKELSGQNTFEFKLYFDKNTPYANFNLWDANGKQIVTLMLSATGYFYKIGSTNSKDICKLYPGQWQEFKIVTDGDKNICNIYMNDELVAKDVPFRFNGTNKINKISVSSPKSGTGSIYINDISYVSTHNIKSIEDIKPVYLMKDTEASKLPLPEYVNVILEDDSASKVRVNWDKTSYVPSQVGKQTLSGNLELPSNITTENLEIQIELNVVDGIIGDIFDKGVITSNEASVILQNVFGGDVETKLDERQKVLADADKDREVSTNDAALILRKVIDSITK